MALSATSRLGIGHRSWVAPPNRSGRVQIFKQPHL